MKNCEEVGFIDKGNGKHQSNTVYSGGGLPNNLRISRSQVLDTVVAKIKKAGSTNL